MPAEDVERFEAAAGELLDDLGYARAFLHPRLEALERAAGVREIVAREAALRPKESMPKPKGNSS